MDFKEATSCEILVAPLPYLDEKFNKIALPYLFQPWYLLFEIRPF